MVDEFYYHIQSPPSCVVRMVLKELCIEHKENVVDIMTEQQKDETNKKLNPHMQVPFIKDGDLIVSESRAIATYLCQKYEKADKKEKLFPTDLVEVAKFNSLLFRDVDNYHKLENYLNLEAVYTGKAKGTNEALLPKVLQVLAEYDAVLANHDYIFGNHLAILDFFCIHTVAIMDINAFDKWDDYPNLKAWRARLATLPYFDDCVKESIEANKKFWKELLETGPAMLQQQKIR